MGLVAFPQAGLLVEVRVVGHEEEATTQRQFLAQKRGVAQQISLSHLELFCLIDCRSFNTKYAVETGYNVAVCKAKSIMIDTFLIK